jgi:hypothetical protein
MGRAAAIAYAREGADVDLVLAGARHRWVRAALIDFISHHLFVPLRERQQTLLSEFVGLSSQAPAPCGLLF